MLTYITSVCTSRRTAALQALLHPSGRHVSRTAGPRPPRSGVEGPLNVIRLSKIYILTIVSMFDGHET